MAFSGYRMFYASIWDWRINHIPLNRTGPFPGPGTQLENAVFTRQAGWGGSGDANQPVPIGGNDVAVEGTSVAHDYTASSSRKPVGSGHSVRVASDSNVYA
jgi:hypothetical protein